MKYLILFLLLQFVFSQQTNQTIHTGKCGNNCTWIVNEQERTLTLKGTGKMVSYSYKSNDVEYEPYAEFIENVKFEGSLEDIGGYAFDNLYNLKNITIPPSVKYIGEDAFRGCNSFTEIVIPNTVTGIGTYLFSNCIKLKKIIFEEPCQLSKISENFLQYSALEEIEIPESIEGLDKYSFSNSNVRKVVIGKNLSSINSQAFSSAYKLEEIIVHPENMNFSSEDGILYNKYKTKLIHVPYNKKVISLKIKDSVKSTESNCIFEHPTIKTVIFPKNFNSLNTYFARYASNLQTITIPDNVKKITTRSFADISSLISVSFGKGTYLVDQNGLSYTKFPKLTVFADNSTFNKNAFSSGKITNMEFYGNMDSFNCPSTNALSNLKLNISVLPEYKNVKVCSKSVKGDLQWTYEGTLAKNTNIKWKVDIKERKLTITVVDENGNKEIPDYTEKQLPEYYYWQDVVRNVEIDTNITKIGNYAFYLFAHVSQLTLPTSLERIGDNSFGYWQQLEEVKIPTSVKTISDKAFKDCVSIVNITIDEANQNYKSIDGVVYKKESENVSSLFYFPPQNTLEEFTFDGNVLSKLSFLDNSQLKKITFTATGKITIKQNAFENSYGLKEVIFKNADEIEVEDYAFKNCFNLENIAIEKITSFGKGSFYNCAHLKEIKISNNITELPDQLFMNCTYLESFTFGDKIVKIGSETFKNCLHLNLTELPSSIVSIGKGAFTTNNNLVDFTIKGKIKSLGTTIFKDCIQLRTIKFEQEIMIDTLPNDFCSGCISLQTIFISKSFKKVGNYAFKGCSQLKSIIFENGSVLEIIGQSFCQNCVELHEIKLPGNITTIEKNAFNGCTKLSTINFPDSIEKIGDSAFNGCTQIQQKTIILKNIKELGQNALSSIPLETVIIGPYLPTEYLSFESFNMETLIDITLFSSFFSFYDSYERPIGPILSCATPKEDIIEYIEYVEGEVNKNDENLFNEYIVLLEEDFNIDIHSLTDCHDMTGFEFNSRTGEMKWFGIGIVSNRTCLETISKMDKIKSISFAPTITGIAEEMFSNVTQLTTINLLPTITYIGNNAFSGCSQLVYINYNSTTPFENCPKNAFTNRNVDYVIVQDYKYDDFCGIKAYNSSEYAPKPPDENSNKLPKRPRNDANSIIQYIMIMMMLLIITI